MKPRILVIGDLMIDHYLWGECDRISPEAPVAVVDIRSENKRLGGAGNVMANLKALGLYVGVMSVVGDDESGKDIVLMLENMGVKIEKIVKEKDRKSAHKTRIMAVHQQVIRFDKESKDDILETSKDELLNSFKDIIKNYDAVLLSDYAKGVLRDDFCKQIIKIANENSKFILIDPKGSNYSKYQNATLLTPNLKEAMQALKMKIDDDASLKLALKRLKDELNLTYSIITLSERGIALYNNDEVKIIPAIAKEVFDVTGAGDTVLATLGYALSNKMDIVSALSLANKAAAVVVGKVGSATASLDEIEKYSKSSSSTNLEEKIKSLDEICQILKNSDKKVVFTNGCFDILHAGHIKYLNKAKKLGDILIIGLNSDSSVKRLKGKTRPINSQDSRALLLSALEFVDFVVIFDEDTPLNLIEKIRPDILVKGADYTGKEVVGSNIAKEVVLVEFEDGFSTTNIINKIKG
ncbi:D-glycero-beta-D-manno-heptose-7-phosphate kinase [Campylobacter ureolyticus]|uniref:Bifunctional protein HldE n=1 Tax=Campylobacter ureolyticus TaxID=827 RepID=A0A9Q4PTD0_9BACT|nr:D-glycero-beta-D-manno-heptose-7-phosphate kinase [Campylobacter ureolyticus]MCZ6103056.1 D-glycero-beta-D-manno-heptose-7-phosphate kinase [Campylobacter ureolyticus]MCZ6134182.1 D-glycero-beta-D-manno-heptose-7-phosphate kinase [Campylobacter ureolyticus]MCZ6161228.1 D-glycero-beta-D-manno-heptose-7-phosphate kinase [Campylobacter ureolyticus]MCZ6170488.1 D-glycero-beta-D-manno-heptose-7-phosphate kinase [Campylobacter ureolyticus]MDU4981008.1 D-glycero-beta-D-manno-heptose-7-phosphate ki